VLIEFVNQFTMHGMNKMKGFGMSRSDVNLQLRTTNLSTESLRFMLGNKNLV